MDHPGKEQPERSWPFGPFWLRGLSFWGRAGWLEINKLRGDDPEVRFVELAVKVQLGKEWALELCRFQVETG